MSDVDPPPAESPRQVWLEEQYRDLASLAGGLAHEIRTL